ncbi:MAG: hypothetical protein PHW92_02485 [Lutibacter sp.]|nr:hypothetical protein [Lutibacter sp.]
MEDRRQKSEDGRSKTGDRSRKTEVGRPKSEDRSRKTEVGRPKSEDRSRKTEVQPQLIPLSRSLSRFSSGRVRGV